LTRSLGPAEPQPTGNLGLPPWHGSSPTPFVCGGAQRGISLATGFFTGESRRKPLGARSGKKRLVIKGLRNHDLGVLDSFAESREASFRKPPCRKPASGSHLPEAIESACIFRLTQVPPLTYLRIPRACGQSFHEDVATDSTACGHPVEMICEAI